MKVITRRDEKVITWNVTDELDSLDEKSDGELQQWTAEVGQAWVYIRLKIYINGEGRLDGSAYKLKFYTADDGLVTEESWDTLIEALTSGVSMLVDYL